MAMKWVAQMPKPAAAASSPNQITRARPFETRARWKRLTATPLAKKQTPAARATSSAGHVAPSGRSGPCTWRGKSNKRYEASPNGNDRLQLEATNTIRRHLSIWLSRGFAVPPNRRRSTLMRVTDLSAGRVPFMARQFHHAQPKFQLLSHHATIVLQVVRLNDVAIGAEVIAAGDVTL